MSAESVAYSRTCGRVLASEVLDGELFTRLRDEFLRCETPDELNPEAREWYDRFAEVPRS